MNWQLRQETSANWLGDNAYITHGCACNCASASLLGPWGLQPALPSFNLDNGNRIRICFSLWLTVQLYNDGNGMIWYSSHCHWRVLIPKLELFILNSIYAVRSEMNALNELLLYNGRGGEATHIGRISRISC